MDRNTDRPGTPLLDRVNVPADLRNYSNDQLKQVADELRAETISTVSVTGGHLGSSLGVVELTVAIHAVFETPHDRLIWDVGHQCYPHKILTGRRDRIRTLRQPGGLSGFTKRSESEYDPFGAAHSSTSISAGLGMAVASNLQGKPRNVIAVMPGSDPTLASEYVLVGAHNDHVGTSPVAIDHDSLRAVNTVTRPQGANDPACLPTTKQQQKIDSLIAAARRVRPPRRDSIFNGADDDGSGTVVLLEIAEQFAAEKPKRSIIFVSHQGEEAGLLGSAWFVDHPTVPLTSIVAAHNMDMLGKGRVDQVKFGGPASVQMLGARRLSREFGDIIDSVNATRTEVMAIDKSWDVTANPLNRFCRSDQVSYVRKDIPVTYFSLGYAQDYHQLTDEPQYIEYDHAARLGRFIHDVMLAIATRTDRPAIGGADPSYPQCAR